MSRQTVDFIVARLRLEHKLTSMLVTFSTSITRYIQRFNFNRDRNESVLLDLKLLTETTGYANLEN